MAFCIGAALRRQVTVRPDLVRVDQSGVGQHVEMFHDRRQRHLERLGERADGKVRLLGKPRHQGPPRRVGKRSEGAIERLGT